MPGLATNEDYAPVPAKGSGLGGSSTLSSQERLFARDYVLNGGNATRAAATAGYSEADLAKAGRRCLLRPRVLAEIKRLSVVNAAAFLPVAVRVLVEIACNPEASDKARVDAANSLLDRGGMGAPKGGTHVNVALQVNNGAEVQALISEVWTAKAQREGKLSAIVPGMPDNDPEDDELIDAAPDRAVSRLEPPSPAPGMGGGVRQSGSPPPPRPIPLPSRSPCRFPQGARPGGDARKKGPRRLRVPHLGKVVGRTGGAMGPLLRTATRGSEMTSGLVDLPSGDGAVPLSEIIAVGRPRENAQGVALHPVKLRDGTTFETVGAEFGGLASRPVQLIPAEPGTRLIHVDDGPLYRTRLIAWALCLDGEVRAVTAGGVMDGVAEGQAYVEHVDGSVDGVGMADPSGFTDLGELAAHFGLDAVELEGSRMDPYRRSPREGTEPTGDEHAGGGDMAARSASARGER